MADYQSIYNTQLQTANEAAAPTIASLEAQQDPLKARYEGLIKTLQGNKEQDIGYATRQTNRDFEARGINPNSGLFQQTLGERVVPITSDYNNRIATATTDQDVAIKDLLTKIAAVRQQASETAASRALSLYDIANANEQAQIARDAAAAEARRQAAALAASLRNVGGGGNNNPKPAVDYLGAARQYIFNKASGDRNRYVDAKELSAAFNHLTSQYGLNRDQANSYLQQLVNSGIIEIYTGGSKPFGGQTVDISAFKPGQLGLQPKTGGIDISGYSGKIGSIR